jgi:hypothetical protein
MNKTAILVPFPGVIVRDPITYSPLNIMGEEKPLSGREGVYWVRRIKDGSVFVEDIDEIKKVEEEIKTSQGELLSIEKSLSLNSKKLEAETTKFHQLQDKLSKKELPYKKAKEAYNKAVKEIEKFEETISETGRVKPLYPGEKVKHPLKKRHYYHKTYIPAKNAFVSIEKEYEEILRDFNKSEYEKKKLEEQQRNLKDRERTIKEQIGEYEEELKKADPLDKSKKDKNIKKN